MDPSRSASYDEPFRKDLNTLYHVVEKVRERTESVALPLLSQIRLLQYRDGYSTYSCDVHLTFPDRHTMEENMALDWQGSTHSRPFYQKFDVSFSNDGKNTVATFTEKTFRSYPVPDMAQEWGDPQTRRGYVFKKHFGSRARNLDSEQRKLLWSLLSKAHHREFFNETMRNNLKVFSVFRYGIVDILLSGTHPVSVLFDLPIKRYYDMHEEDATNPHPDITNLINGFFNEKGKEELDKYKPLSARGWYCGRKNPGRLAGLAHFIDGGAFTDYYSRVCPEAYARSKEIQEPSFFMPYDTLLQMEKKCIHELVWKHNPSAFLLDLSKDHLYEELSEGIEKNTGVIFEFFRGVEKTREIALSEKTIEPFLAIRKEIDLLLRDRWNELPERPIYAKAKSDYVPFLTGFFREYRENEDSLSLIYEFYEKLCKTFPDRMQNRIPPTKEYVEFYTQYIKKSCSLFKEDIAPIFKVCEGYDPVGKAIPLGGPFKEADFFHFGFIDRFFKTYRKEDENKEIFPDFFESPPISPASDDDFSEEIFWSKVPDFTLTGPPHRKSSRI